MHCPNKDKGCECQDKVNAIAGHLGDKDGCQFQVIVEQLNSNNSWPDMLRLSVKS